MKDKTAEAFDEAMDIVRRMAPHTLAPALPLLLKLKGQPFDICERAPFEPMFRVNVPQQQVFKTGRQVSKTTNAAARSILFSSAIPWHSTIFVAPLFNQIRNISNNYVSPFLQSSTFGNQLDGDQVVRNVLQKSFANGSKLMFTYVGGSADRARGLSGDSLIVDEAQDTDRDLLAIVEEALSASKYKIKTYMGTSKEPAGALDSLFEDSSQAEWVTRCSCGYWNVASLACDLERMVGPVRDDVSDKWPGTICAKCEKPINPSEGHFEHMFPERRWWFAGWHIPQQILPMHYAMPGAWRTLVEKKEGRVSRRRWLNEVCGEPFAGGGRLITEGELRAACVLNHANTLEAAEKLIGKYTHRVLGVDWGGGGGESEEDCHSWTVYSVMGITVDGLIDVIYSHKSLTPYDAPGEAKLALELLAKFKCHCLAHDYSGAGTLRETIIVSAGYPSDRTVPISYVRLAHGDLIKMVPPSIMNPKRYWRVDKTRSLQLVCELIKLQRIRFFKYDYVDADRPGLIRDFLALLESKIDSKVSNDVYTVIRDPRKSDDFAQSVNLGACVLWHITGRWPNLGQLLKVSLPAHMHRMFHPQDDEMDWNDVDVHDDF